MKMNIELLRRITTRYRPSRATIAAIQFNNFSGKQHTGGKGLEEPNRPLKTFDNPFYEYLRNGEKQLDYIESFSQWLSERDDKLPEPDCFSEWLNRKDDRL